MFNLFFFSGARITYDGNYVLLTISQDCEPVNRLWYVDLRTLKDGITKNPDWVKLIDNFDAEYEVSSRHDIGCYLKRTFCSYDKFSTNISPTVVKTTFLIHSQLCTSLL